MVRFYKGKQNIWRTFWLVKNRCPPQAVKETFVAVAMWLCGGAGRKHNFQRVHELIKGSKQILHWILKGFGEEASCLKFWSPYRERKPFTLTGQWSWARQHRSTWENERRHHKGILSLVCVNFDQFLLSMSTFQLVHNCTIFLSSLDIGNIDNQYRGPSIKEKDHLVGWLTTFQWAPRLL